jgi:HemY protein
MRMIRAVLVIAAVAAAAVFLTDNPGQVEIAWRGWLIETSVGVLIAAAVLAALAAAFVLRLISLIVGSPTAFVRRRRERRRHAGYEALTRGMVAVAAGDPQQARRFARRAEALLAEPPLTLLLSAQAAQIGGDELAAKKFFTAMLDRPETEFLGLRGLLNQALRDGDRAAARGLAERALELRPNVAWALSSLFDLEVGEERWEMARRTLDRAARRGFIAPETARHRRGVILYELSRTAAVEGDRQRALSLAAEAQSQTGDLATPAAHYARLLLAEGRPGRAAKVIERAWRTAPHPELAGIYGEIGNTETALARVTRFERLAQQNLAARESHLSVVEAALAAELWGEARRHLDRAFAADPPPVAALPVNSVAAGSPSPLIAGDSDPFARATPRLCLLMARLIEAEHDDPRRVREWLDRAVAALPEPRYICANCGGEHGEWHSLCPRCGTFDALSWHTPASTGASAARPAAIAAPTGDKAPARIAAAEPVLPLAGSTSG